MGKYIVMDIVFYGNSLNYDQGSGNYQELKKITKWDGRQYTLVSRYALRYSLLETAKNMGLWEIGEGEILTTETGRGNKEGSIQPKPDLLCSGDILSYPEFDLFGYLITSTQPPNSRTAPVKINHAVSMTHFNYDALFNANLGLANRMRKFRGDMPIDPFTSEEHETFYQYTTMIDVSSVGNLEVYLAKKIKEKNTEKTINSIQIKQNETSTDFEISYGTNEPLKFVHKNNSEPKTSISKIILPFKSEDSKVKISGMESSEIIEYNENLGAMIVKYELDEDTRKKRIKNLINAILNLNRSIKGRCEDLSPKLMILGVYKDKPYKTYKDKIALLDKYVEEEYDEIEESPLENGGKLLKVRHKTIKSRKPIFEIIGLNNALKLDEEKVFRCINHLFEDKKDSQEEATKKNENSDSDNESAPKGCEEVTIFYDPSIKVEFKKNS